MTVSAQDLNTIFEDGWTAHFEIQTTYPGQSCVVRNASKHEIEHYLSKDWDLPFVEPIGAFAEVVRAARDLTLPPGWTADFKFVDGSLLLTGLGWRRPSDHQGRAAAPAAAPWPWGLISLTRGAQVSLGATHENSGAQGPAESGAYAACSSSAICASTQGNSLPLRTANL